MIIEQIKEAIRIEDLIAQTHTVTGRPPTLTTTAHDSLKIFTKTNTWYWYSIGKGGDALDWYMHQHGCDLTTAIDELVRMAGIERRPPTAAEVAARAEQDAVQDIYRIAAAYFHAQMDSPAGQAARAYCSQRGWTPETIARETLGYSGDNKRLSPEDDITSLYKQLLAAGHINHPLAKAVLSIPPGSIVYVHRKRGRITYLSARGIEQKRHYNLPAELAGQKQPYLAEPVTAVTDDVILVEGQADAISLAQVGLRAVALCGLSTGDLDLSGISHVAFDTDKAGQTKALDIALSIDPALRIVQWNAGKDANDCLRAGYGIDQFANDLDAARPAIFHLAAEARNAKGDDRTALIRRFFELFADLDDIQATDWKPDLAAQLCGGIAQFNRLHKAHNKQTEQDGEHESPERYMYSAGGVKGGRIWEQIITGNGDGSRRSLFAVRGADGRIAFATSVEIGSTTYLPYPIDLGIIDADVVLFPSAAEDYGDMRKLVKEIQQFIHRYLDVDPFYEKLAAYYVLFTWVYDLFENLPYLRALGDYGTGKTRFLQAIGVLCYRPMFVSGASSVSPIFRLIDMFNGTLIIDEADFSNSDAESEIIKIMNVGYYRNGVVLRAEKDQASSSEQWSPQVYKVYGPKIMATRRPFTDRATESRCLTKRMTTARPRPEIPYILGQDFWDDATRIRNKLLKYRLDSHRPVVIDHALADESVEPRLNQVTMALKSIVDVEMREEIDTFVRAYNIALISDRQMTAPAMIVQALADIHFDRKTSVFGEDMRDFTMKGIADKARGIANEIDPEIKIHPRMVSKTLSEELGMNRRTRDKTSSRSRLDYEEHELFALMKRYGIEVPQ